MFLFKISTENRKIQYNLRKAKDQDLILEEHQKKPDGY